MTFRIQLFDGKNLSGGFPTETENHGDSRVNVLQQLLLDFLKYIS